MNKERLEYLMSRVNRKLKERQINSGDHDAAIEALSGCVMAGQLIAAYKITNNLQ